MARPIPLELPQRNPKEELYARLQNGPAEHAEAVLAALQVLQELHNRGMLETLRGVLSSGDKVLEQIVDATKRPESIRAMRNLLLLAKTMGTIEPELLGNFTRAIPQALAQANAEESKPPGLIKLVSTFWNKDFRRGLAVFNDLLVMFGKNLDEKPHH
jgi:uncharacterized protein YjgD (DUF1641 family)